MAYQEYQVISGDAWARDIPGWTVWADSPKEAEERAQIEQDRGGGRGPIAVRGPLTPECDLCGCRHQPPPDYFDKNAYCR